MTKETVCARIEQVGIIPAIRLSSAEDALFAAEAVASCGIPIVEVTMTVPGALDVVSELARRIPDLIVGAGTIVKVETARQCLDAGARFLTSPGLNPAVVEFAVDQKVAVFPGALTPSEIMAAWNAGSDFVKIFPCSQLGGPPYIKALKTPFPDVKLIASGGVNQRNIAEFILAGAVAVGIGRDLIHPQAIQRREAHWIDELAGRYLQIIKDARAQKAGK
jgi:2-dehydro-3-deoxyphosphogluconate aldolase/(4S)-4-hydroxy-2-oxoglutarate aldolase